VDAARSILRGEGHLLERQHPDAGDGGEEGRGGGDEEELEDGAVLRRLLEHEPLRRGLHQPLQLRDPVRAAGAAGAAELGP
jgi:hypothetical protein